MANVFVAFALFLEFNSVSRIYRVLLTSSFFSSYFIVACWIPLDSSTQGTYNLSYGPDL